jgi:hypothetical protein
MGISRLFAVAMLAWWACGASHAALTPPATSIKRPSQRAEVKLVYGLNDVKVRVTVLRIVRGRIGTLSASDFDTYTIYLVPDNKDDPWLHVTVPATKGIGYTLRDYETGDANTQATAFYRDGKRLYAVQASKVGAEADANGALKTPFEIKVFVFNDNDEVPMLDNSGVMRTKRVYVDAREALQHEFFLL